MLFSDFIVVIHSSQSIAYCPDPPNMTQQDLDSLQIGSKKIYSCKTPFFFFVCLFLKGGDLRGH